MKAWKDCLTEADRWAWHTEVYAFRRITLGVPDAERVSPVDPQGKWFDEFLVREATARMRDEQQRQERARLKALRGSEAWQANQERYRLADAWRRDNPEFSVPMAPRRRRAPTAADMGVTAAEVGAAVKSVAESA